MHSYSTPQTDCWLAARRDRFIIPEIDRSYLAYYLPTPPPFFRFVSGHFPSQTVTAPHSHPVHAMHGCLHEPLRLSTSAGDFDLDAGDFCLIAPGVEHYWLNYGPRTAATIAVLFHVNQPGRWPTRSGVARALRDLEQKVVGVQWFRSSGDHSLQHVFWRLADQLTGNAAHREIDVAGCLLTFLSVVLRKLDGSQAVAADNSIARRIRQVLMSRVNERLTIADVARHVHVSPTRAKSEFRKTYGCGIKTYFNQLKIWQAKRQLCDPNLTIEKISRQLGFSSPAYFTRAFLRHTGETPSDFRTKNCVGR